MDTDKFQKPPPARTDLAASKEMPKMPRLNPFSRRPAPPAHPATGDPVRDMTEVLLRIEAHLADLAARTKSVDRLERRLQGIETALKNI